MGLFDKKFCDVCGAKIGLLGNKKLEDGNLCKECASKLSPFFSERRHSTLEDIKRQLDYREANKERVAAFNPTKVIKGTRDIYFDEDKRRFFVTYSKNWRNENPDIIDFSAVTGCDLDIDESSEELFRKNANGEEVSYNPPRYEYSYDFYITIMINCEWFNEIRIKLNENEIHQKIGGAYAQTEREAREIKAIFAKIHDEARATAAPKKSVICPYCGASTVPDASGNCEYCGSPVG